MTYCDSAVTMPDLKLFIAGNYAIGFCGDCRLIPTLKRWFTVHNCNHELASQEHWNDEYDLLAMDAEGRLFIILADTLCQITEEFFSIGSGRMAAMGAMASGASPEEAIQIAALYDVHTAVPVQTLTLDTLRASIRQSKPVMKSPWWKLPKRQK
jgi:hypothetical protein